MLPSQHQPSCHCLCHSSANIPGGNSMSKETGCKLNSRSTNLGRVKIPFSIIHRFWSPPNIMSDGYPESFSWNESFGQWTYHQKDASCIWRSETWWLTDGVSNGPNCESSHLVLSEDGDEIGLHNVVSLKCCVLFRQWTIFAWNTTVVSSEYVDLYLHALIHATFTQKQHTTSILTWR
jgi:hypothetical protein